MSEKSNHKSLKQRLILSLGLTTALMIFIIIGKLIYIKNYNSSENLSLSQYIFLFSQLFIECYLLFLIIEKLSIILDKFLPWKKSVWFRGIIEFIIASIISSVVFYSFFILVGILYKEWVNLITISYTIIIAIIISMLVAAIIEGIKLFHQWEKSLTKKHRLEKQSTQTQSQVLNSQISPHFLFNSLNALHSLIDISQDKAQQFVIEFKKIYKYVLETSNQNITSIQNEIQFINSYMYLQKIRHGENLNLSISIDNDKLNKHIMPLALQLVVENAIKHNEISHDFPLQITIKSTSNYIEIRNKLKVRNQYQRSTKLGQKNLLKRYEMIYDKLPEFIVDNKDYLVRIPII